MKNKKILLGIVALGFATFLLAQSAFALDYAYYNLRLPATGVLSTLTARKPDNYARSVNQVEYIGWAGSGLLCYANDPFGGGQLTSKTAFSTTGSKTIWWYQNLADKYEDMYINMVLKTDTTTWHECDVRGTFRP